MKEQQQKEQYSINIQGSDEANVTATGEEDSERRLLLDTSEEIQGGNTHTVARRGFSKKQVVRDFLGMTVPFSLSSFVITVPNALIVRMLTSYENGLSASAYINGVIQIILEPLTGLTTVAGNFTGIQAGKISDKDLDAELKHLAEREIGHIFRQTTIIALATAVPSTIIVLATAPFLRAIGQPEGAVNVAQQVFNALSIGIVPQLLYRGQFQPLLGLGKSKAMFISLASYSALDVALSYVMMKGVFNWEGMGPAGMGYANAITAWISWLGLVGYFKFNPEFAPYKMFACKFGRLDILKNLLQVGAPIWLKFFFDEFGLVASSLMLGKLGEAELSASQVVSQYTFVATVFVLFGADTGSALVSTARGERNFSKARFIGDVGLTYGLSFASLTMVLFFGIPNQLSSLFTNDKYVLELAKWLFIVQGGNLFLDTVRNYQTGYLRGVDDTNMAMGMSFITLVLFVGVGWALGFPAGFGSSGVFLGRTLGLFAAAGILTAKWYRLIDKIIGAGKFEKDEQQEAQDAARQLLHEAFGEEHVTVPVAVPVTQSSTSTPSCFSKLCRWGGSWFNFFKGNSNAHDAQNVEHELSSPVVL
jgi:MATE family multidrug resistance protein